MAINFEEENIKFIVENMVVSCFKEYSEMLLKTLSEGDDNSFKIVEKVMDIVSVKFKQIELENIKNMSFIKAVLFVNKLSDEEHYKKYMDEWGRLNKDYIDGLKLQ